MEHPTKEPFTPSDHSPEIEDVSSVEVENYHGLSAKTVLVYLSLELITFAQIVNLIGAGAYARYIALAVGGPTQTVWLSQAIAILTCVLGLPVSQAADYWGRKRFLVITTLLGFAGGMVVARSTSMGMAIAGEVLCGIGFGSQPLLYAVSSEILPRRFRPAAQGGINVAIGLAGIFALLVGFTLVKACRNGFRTYWYITSAILLVSAILCALLYNPPPRPLQRSLTFQQKIRQLDWVGYALLTAGVVLFTMALSWSENPFSWKDAHILAPFVIGIALLLCLGVHQVLIKQDGMFHHELFGYNRNFAIALFGIFVEGMVFFSAINYFAFEVSVLYETDPFRAGLRFSITFFTSTAASLAISVFSSLTRTIRGPTILAYLCFVIFNVLIATAKTTSSAAVWAYPIFLGLGLGICLTCIVTARTTE